MPGNSISFDLFQKQKKCDGKHKGNKGRKIWNQLCHCSFFISFSKIANPRIDGTQRPTKIAPSLSPRNHMISEKIRQANDSNMRILSVFPIPLSIVLYLLTLAKIINNNENMKGYLRVQACYLRQSWNDPKNIWLIWLIPRVQHTSHSLQLKRLIISMSDDLFLYCSRYRFKHILRSGNEEVLIFSC